MKIAIIGGSIGSLVGFRRVLIQEMIASGHSVHCFSPGGDTAEVAKATLEAWGARWSELSVTRSGLNLFKELATFRSLVDKLSRLKPDAVFAYNTKAILYGTVAAKLARVDRITVMFEGLGYPFAEGRELRRRVVRLAVSAAFRLVAQLANRFIVLNRDDHRYLASDILSRKVDCLHVIPGIGVDLEEFKPTSLPPMPLTFIMICRLLLDKGVREYIYAAKAARRLGLSAQFILVGGTDENPASISPQELKNLLEDGVVNYAGEVSDVRPWIAQSHVFVLPTFYREGAPRTIIEALSMGRPCITTRSPGCSDLVEDGVNGFLVPARSVQALLAAMQRFETAPELLNEFSIHALERRDEFDARVIARHTMEIVTAGHMVEERSDARQ